MSPEKPLPCKRQTGSQKRRSVKKANQNQQKSNDTQVLVQVSVLA